MMKISFLLEFVQECRIRPMFQLKMMLTLKTLPLAGCIIIDQDLFVQVICYMRRGFGFQFVAPTRCNQVVNL